ncbi:MAG: Phosphoglucomutase/phosphomannomutase, alpha/beta/alpha domain, partial [Deltaproteobacteria bacterium]|nr:Phosphoglucomutase/phosphomannomutase, alpha/beta/alpha domain [Deltaproteobacteria bacterium]
KSVDARAIKERNFNIVLDYSYGSAAVIFPRILGQLGVETVAPRSPGPSPRTSG